MIQGLYHRYRKTRAIKTLNKEYKTKKNSMFPSKNKVGISLSPSMAYLIYNQKVKVKKGIIQETFWEWRQDNITQWYENYTPSLKINLM